MLFLIFSRALPGDCGRAEGAAGVAGTCCMGAVSLGNAFVAVGHGRWGRGSCANVGPPAPAPELTPPSPSPRKPLGLMFGACGWPSHGQEKAPDGEFLPYSVCVDDEEIKKDNRLSLATVASTLLKRARLHRPMSLSMSPQGNVYCSRDRLFEILEGKARYSGCAFATTPMCSPWLKCW